MNLLTESERDFLSDLSRIYANADRSALKILGPWIAATMSSYRIDSPLRQAHFLAQVGHESGELRYREELASGRAYEGRKDLGNTRPGDGAKFKGRGLIQLTGRANYAQYDRGKGLEGRLLTDPGLVARDPELCCDVAGWYWSTRSLNALADRDDLTQITRRINGGLNGFEDRRRLLLIAKSALLPRQGRAVPNGSARNTVSDLQILLNRTGADLVVDGVAGPRTEAAVRVFQGAHGLVVDGVAGPLTWDRLREAVKR